MGYLDIPVIDVRHDREAQLNMHHLSASFATRLRIERALGDSARQLIWVAELGFDPTLEALRVMDEWIGAVRAQPWRGVAGNRPARADDACFDAGGRTLARGPEVWDGDWNGAAPGACTRAMRSFGTSRSAAGGPLAGDLFQCRLQSVEAAIAAGVYRPVDLRPHAARLREIFPQGVCDYRRGDAGRPADAVPARWRRSGDE